MEDEPIWTRERECVVFERVSGLDQPPNFHCKARHATEQMSRCFDAALSQNKLYSQNGIRHERFFKDDAVHRFVIGLVSLKRRDAVRL